MTTRPTDSSLANPPRGVLHPDFSATHYDLTRTLPPPTLAPFVELFWVVKWDLRERPPHLQQNIPHPCVHLVVESGNTRVLGLVKGRFVRQLQGKGRIVGAKFKPGGFHPFVAGSVSKLTQRQWALRRIFGVDSGVLEAPFRQCDEDDIEGMVELVRNFLLERAPDTLDPNVERVQRWVRWITSEPELTSVESLVERTGLATRSVQRLFKDYVGVSPKWTIRLFRIQDALDRVASRDKDWAELAVELGYFDQSHFIRDFKAIVGATPGAYCAAASQRTG